MRSHGRERRLGRSILGTFVIVVLSILFAAAILLSPADALSPSDHSAMEIVKPGVDILHPGDLADKQMASDSGSGEVLVPSHTSSSVSRMILERRRRRRQRLALLKLQQRKEQRRKKRRKGDDRSPLLGMDDKDGDDVSGHDNASDQHALVSSPSSSKCSTGSSRQPLDNLLHPSDLSQLIASEDQKHHPCSPGTARIAFDWLRLSDATAARSAAVLLGQNIRLVVSLALPDELAPPPPDLSYPCPLEQAVMTALPRDVAVDVRCVDVDRLTRFVREGGNSEGNGGRSRSSRSSGGISVSTVTTATTATTATTTTPTATTTAASITADTTAVNAAGTLDRLLLGPSLQVALPVRHNGNNNNNNNHHRNLEVSFPTNSGDGSRGNPTVTGSTHAAAATTATATATAMVATEGEGQHKRSQQHLAVITPRCPYPLPRFHLTHRKDQCSLTPSSTLLLPPPSPSQSSSGAVALSESSSLVTVTTPVTRHIIQECRHDDGDDAETATNSLAAPFSSASASDSNPLHTPSPAASSSVSYSSAPSLANNDADSDGGTCNGERESESRGSGSWGGRGCSRDSSSSSSDVIQFVQLSVADDGVTQLTRLTDAFAILTKPWADAAALVTHHGNSHSIPHDRSDSTTTQPTSLPAPNTPTTTTTTTHGNATTVTATVTEAEGTALLPSPPHSPVVPSSASPTATLSSSSTSSSSSAPLYPLVHSLPRGTGRVLVHCIQGRSRSPALLIAYLMRVHGMSLRRAVRTVRAQRPCVQPHFRWFEQLLAIERMVFPGLPPSMSHADNYVPLVPPPPPPAVPPPTLPPPSSPHPAQPQVLTLTATPSLALALSPALPAAPSAVTAAVAATATTTTATATATLPSPPP